MSKQYIRECPICKSQNIVPISYVFPTPEAVEDSKAGKVHLGGCIVDVFNQNNRHWNDCEHQWRKTDNY